MREHPRCPYCNAEMYPNETLGGQRFYNCRICGACSPRKSNLKDAREAALKICIAKELAKISKAYTAFCIAHSGTVARGCACDSCLFRHLPCLAAADSDEVSEYDWRNALEILEEFKGETK